MSKEMDCKCFNTKILPYLSGELSEEENERFEMHYFTCDSCYNQLKISQLLHSGRVPIKPRVKKRKSFFFKPAFAISFIFVLVFAISSFYFFTNENQKNALYKISKFIPPVYIKTETRSDNNEILFDRAMKFYQKKDYSNSLKYLKKIVLRKNTNYKVIFFRGICNLIEDNLQESIEDFSIIIRNMNPSYFDEAIYYRGIAQLRKGKKNEAVLGLKNISTDDYSPLKNKAIDLISRIRQL